MGASSMEMDARRAGAAPQKPSRVAQQLRLMAGTYQFQPQAERLALAGGKIARGIHAHNAERF